MGNFLNNKSAQVVAVCDVKKDQLELARAAVNQHYQNKDCAVTGDFRELVARKDIDAFLIATPDHWHVPLPWQRCAPAKMCMWKSPSG